MAVFLQLENRGTKAEPLLYIAPVMWSKDGDDVALGADCWSMGMVDEQIKLIEKDLKAIRKRAEKILSGVTAARKSGA